MRAPYRADGTEPGARSRFGLPTDRRGPMTDEYDNRYVPTILQPLVDRLATDDIAAVADALGRRFSTTETLDFFLDYVEEEGMIPPARLQRIRRATASRRYTPSYRLAASSSWEAPRSQPVLFDGLSVFPRSTPSNSWQSSKALLPTVSTRGAVTVRRFLQW